MEIPTAPAPLKMPVASITRNNLLCLEGGRCVHAFFFMRAKDGCIASYDLETSLLQNPAIHGFVFQRETWAAGDVFAGYIQLTGPRTLASLSSIIKHADWKYADDNCGSSIRAIINPAWPGSSHCYSNIHWLLSATTTHLNPM